VQSPRPRPFLRPGTPASPSLSDGRGRPDRYAAGGGHGGRRRGVTPRRAARSNTVRVAPRRARGERRGGEGYGGDLPAILAVAAALAAPARGRRRGTRRPGIPAEPGRARATRKRCTPRSPPICARGVTSRRRPPRPGARGVACRSPPGTAGSTPRCSGTRAAARPATRASTRRTPDAGTGDGRHPAGGAGWGRPGPPVGPGPPEQSPPRVSPGPPGAAPGRRSVRSRCPGGATAPVYPR